MCLPDGRRFCASQLSQLSLLVIFNCPWSWCSVRSPTACSGYETGCKGEMQSNATSGGQCWGCCAMGQLYQAALSCCTSASLLAKSSQPPAAKLTWISRAALKRFWLLSMGHPFLSFPPQGCMARPLAQ